MSEIQVSVVVPAYNCEDTIEKTIQAILAQAIDSMELIIVDDGSSDCTAEKIKSFDNVKYFYQANSGPAKARNLGAKNAQGKYIFFTDSDCIPEDKWIERGMKFFLEPKVVVVAGSYGIENAQSLLARCIHREILYRHHYLMPEYPKAFGSYNFGIKKNIFWELGGFDEGYRFASGEDNDLSYKIISAGYKIYFCRDMLVRHHHPENLFRYLSEQYRHGFWRAKTYGDHPRMVVGDDYTFWKDMVEVPGSFLLLLSYISIFFYPRILTFPSVVGTILFVVFEIGFAKSLLRNGFESIFMGGVMFLRSFSRMLGLSSGIAHRFLPKAPK